MVSIPRVLVPGTGAGVHTTDTGLRVGQRVVVLPPGTGALPGPNRVGTQARVEAMRVVGHGAAMVRLTGERLVRIERTETQDGRWLALVSPLDDGPVQGAEGLIEAMQAALRRYLAASAEAGAGGDVTVQLSRDPVTASHQVASLLPVSGPEIQEVLEAGGATERLRKSLGVIERETGLLRQFLGREEGAQWRR